jgi:hypothetical protein
MSTSKSTTLFVITTEAPALGAVPPIQVLPSLKFTEVIETSPTVVYVVPDWARDEAGAAKQRVKTPIIVREAENTLRHGVEQ